MSQTIAVALGLIVVFAVGKNLGALFPGGNEVGYFLCLAYQLYVPIWLIGREGKDPVDYGIRMGSLDDLKRTGILCVIVFVPFVVAYHIFQQVFSSYYGYTAVFSLNLRPELLSFFFTNLFLVALPEEIFYRGFLQTRLLQYWPNKTFLFSIPIGRAITVTSLFFALGHLAGETNIMRLAPFFPAYLFSLLVYRSGSIMGAVIFHALCNLLSEFLHSSYMWLPIAHR